MSIFTYFINVDILAFSHGLIVDFINIRFRALNSWHILNI